jgi:hypothetical protein
MPFTILTQGTYTQPATAVAQIINLPSGCDYMKVVNYTQMSAASPTACVAGEWFGGGLTAVNAGLRWRKAGSSAILIDNFTDATATNGFTYITANPSPQAALTGTTITQANPAVATVTNTYSNGDQVIIYNAVGMQQISGMTFTISSVTTSGFTLLGLNSSGFAAAATSFMVRRITQNPQGVDTPVAPSSLYVTAVTNAVGAQVTVSQANQVFVGQKLEFQVPGSFGMVQLDNYYQSGSKPIIVQTIVDAYNFTINIDTTNYTAFAFPASSGSPTTQLFATVAPAGQSTTFNPITNVTTGYNFTQAPFRSGLFLPCMLLGVTAGGASTSVGGGNNDVMIYTAYKMETGTINAPVPS